MSISERPSLTIERRERLRKASRLAFEMLLLSVGMLAVML